MTAIDPVVSAAGPLAIDLDTGLASLVDKSLLIERTRDDHQPRYSMLETIREFALDQLLEAGEEERVRNAHAAWALNLLEPWSIDDPDAFLRLTDLQVLDDEVENIRAAFDHFSTHREAESVCGLVVGLFNYLYTRGRLGKRSRWDGACWSLPRSSRFQIACGADSSGMWPSPRPCWANPQRRSRLGDRGWSCCGSPRRTWTCFPPR